MRLTLPLEQRELFESLNSPQKVQDYVDTLKINFETAGETNFPPLMVIQKKMAHCFERAVCAAEILAYHGRQPLLMDFETILDDEDHTIALFKEGGHWGAISKTNHSVLKYRDPVYASPRELAMSYFHEYYLWDGTKSMRAYSKPFDLSKLPLEKWLLADTLDWLMRKLSTSGYYDVVPQPRNLRNASKIELTALAHVEWHDSRKKH